MAELIISVSGLRGIVGENLTPEIAARFVAAFVDLLPAGPIVVGRDGRSHGPLLAGGVQQAITRAGRECLYADVASTPTIGVLVRDLHAAGGVQISASHNPPQYNGLKLFGADGRVISAGEGARVIEGFRRTTTDGPTSGAATGKVTSLADTTTAHLHKVLATVDVEAIRRRKFRVVLDANHGAGAVLGKPLLEALGCTTTVLGGAADGRFEHPPEPTAENLTSVAEAVRRAAADVGFCQDPDADRLALFDEQARYIGEEYTPALCADHVLARAAGAVVTNCSTSRMTQDVAAKYKLPFSRSAVGEANVCDEMIAQNAVFGGEGNGGVIDPRVGYVRDSFAGMALMLDLLAARSEPLSRVAASLPRYEIVKTKMTLDADRWRAGPAALRKHFADAAASTLDGLRLDWPDKWLLVRASNTEPIVRAIAEAPTAAEAQRLCDEAQHVLARL